MEACKRALVQKLPTTFPTKESYMQKLPHHLFNSNPQSNPFIVSTFLNRSKSNPFIVQSPQRIIFSTFNCRVHDRCVLLKSKEPKSPKTQILLLLIRIEAATSQK
ncbi:hypothetical protein AMTRI_Chr03g148010 [Amborella trichopoda]